jgi:hypothetical protein
VTIEPLPQPRVDTLVTDAAGGEQRRRTEYIGTVWIDGRAEAAGLMLRRVGSPGVVTPAKDVAFFLPDSLPYRRERLDGAQLSVTASLQASGEQSVIFGAEAAFVDDPSGAPAWVRLHISAHTGWPCAVAYRVVALTVPDAVAG